MVGCVGGMYAFGGGAISAPLLHKCGTSSPSEVAPATLTSTFITSIIGVATFVLLATVAQSPQTGDVGIALGIGGIAGSYTRAALQPHLTELAIRPAAGAGAGAGDLGIRYACRPWARYRCGRAPNNLLGDKTQGDLSSGDGVVSEDGPIVRGALNQVGQPARFTIGPTSFCTIWVTPARGGPPPPSTT